MTKWDVLWDTGTITRNVLLGLSDWWSL